MVKTRSDLKGVRVSTKAPRKMPASTSNSEAGNSGRSSKKYSGGNPHCPRETPPWQKEITKFFSTNPNSDTDSSTSGCSSSQSDSASGSNISDS